LEYRRLGNSGLKVSEIGLGGNNFGRFADEQASIAVIKHALDAGINFIDTADVYENRRSEAAVARVVQRRPERVYVATKCGRFINPHVDEGYTTDMVGRLVEAAADHDLEIGLEYMAWTTPADPATARAMARTMIGTSRFQR